MSADSPDLESDLARVLAGDEEASRTLVGRLNPLVMKIAQSHLPRRMAVEDLAQEIFARVFQRLPRYQPRTGVPFEHWVSRLAVRTCLDLLRSERRRPEVREADLDPGDNPWWDYLAGEGSAGESPSGRESDAREAVERLLAELPSEDRFVIAMLDLEERSVAEVAERTGWSRVGVRVRAFRARTRLRRVAQTLRDRGEA